MTMTGGAKGQVQQLIRDRRQDCGDTGSQRLLQVNGYKIPLMRNLVMRALCGVEEARWTS
jgi:hypothetical protein